MIHHRKAGGSTMRKWAGEIIDAHNITLQVFEGQSVGQKAFEKSAFRFTTLVHPVDRYMSLYYYQQRYGGFFHPGKDEKGGKKGWKKRTRVRMSLADSLILSVNETLRGGPRNYYVRTLLSASNKENEYMSADLTAEHLEAAKAVLARIDLVVIREWMFNPEMLKLVRVAAGTDWVIYKNKNVLPQGRPNQHPVAREAKGLKVLPKSIRLQMLEYHALDIQLFEFAVELVASRIRKHVDPKWEIPPMTSFIDNANDTLLDAATRTRLYGYPKGHPEPD